MSSRALLVLALLLAGCAAPAPEDAPPAPDAAGGPEFLPAVEVDIACRSACHEPTLAQDGAGRILVADGAAKEIAVTEDGGATWSTVAPPPVTGPVGALQADVLLQASPSGRLYYSALLLRQLPTGQILLEGIQVAWSEDGGRTWPVNAQLTPLADARATVLAADRQWLGFGEGEETFLTYNQIPSGIWLARSTDGGRTWGEWTRVVPTEQRAGIGQSGPPVVDAEGRVLVPACAHAPRSTVAVYVSADGGRTFQRHDVGGPAGCSWFPVLAAAPDGGVVAAWHDGPGTIRVSASDDGGASWSDPQAWAEDSPTSPWPLALGGERVALAWYEKGADGVDLLVARGSAEEGRGTAVVVATGLPSANTDFAHVIMLKDGRLAAAWSDAADRTLHVGVEAPRA